jgi:hypothetical protein
MPCETKGNRDVKQAREDFSVKVEEVSTGVKVYVAPIMKESLTSRG